MYICTCVYIYIYIYDVCVRRPPAAAAGLPSLRPPPRSEAKRDLEKPSLLSDLSMPSELCYGRIICLGGTQIGSYQTGSYQKGRFIPPKPTLICIVV